MPKDSLPTLGDDPSTGRGYDALEGVEEAILSGVDHGDFLKKGAFRGVACGHLFLETCSIVGELIPIGIDGGSPMSTITQRIASAFVVLCGRYGDVTQMVHYREQSRQSLYREASQVANAVDGTALQSRIDELQRQLAGQQAQIQDLQEADRSTPSRSRATNRTSSPASPKPRGSA